MFWSYLKFLITFFFIYYIFYIFYCKTHFAAVYSLLTLEGSAHLQVPEGQKLRCRLPAATVLPVPTCEAPPASSPEEEEAEPRGDGQDTQEAAARWAALQTLYSCFLRGVPKKSDVTLPRRWIHLLRYRDRIALHLNSQADSSPQDFPFFFFSQQGENKECIHL